MGAAWTPRQRASVVWGAILVFLAMEVLERIFFLTFELNFSTAGPNAWALAVVLLVTAALYPAFLHRLWPHSETLLGACVAVSPFLLAVALAPEPRLALAAALAWNLAATPLLFAIVTALRRRATLVLALGLALRLAVRAWTGNLPLGFSSLGSVLLVAVAVAWAAAWFFVRSDLAAGSRRLPNPAAVWAFLFASVLLLGTPPTAWAWSGAHPGWTHAAALAGTALGTVTALRGSWAGPRRAWQGAAVLIAGAAWLLWIPWPLLAPLGLVAAVWGALLATDSALDRPRHGDLRRHGTLTAVAQAVLVILVFLHVAAVNWAFVAFVGPFLHGHADVLLLLAVSVLALVDLRRRDWATTPEATA